MEILRNADERRGIDDRRGPIEELKWEKTNNKYIGKVERWWALASVVQGKVENAKFKVVKFLGHNILIGIYERQDPLRIGFLLYNTFEMVVMYDEEHEATANFFADDLHWTYG